MRIQAKQISRKKIVKIATCKKLYNILYSALVPLEEIA